MNRFCWTLRFNIENGGGMFFVLTNSWLQVTNRQGIQHWLDLSHMLCGPNRISHRIHVWYIYLHEWLVFMVNVGEYTIHGSYGYRIRVCVLLSAIDAASGRFGSSYNLGEKKTFLSSRKWMGLPGVKKNLLIGIVSPFVTIVGGPRCIRSIIYNWWLGLIDYMYVVFLTIMVLSFHAYTVFFELCDLHGSWLFIIMIL